MEETLGRALPQRISNDLDEFLASPIPAIIDCSNCVTNIPGKESIVHRPCEQTLATRGASCDHCRAAHQACDGDFLGKDRLLWMLARYFREQQALPFDPLSPVLEPETPEYLPGSPRPEWLDPDYEPSEINELEDDINEQEMEDVQVPVIYDGIPQEVLDYILAHDVAALAAEELAAPAAAAAPVEPEPEGAPGNPILVE